MTRSKLLTDIDKKTHQRGYELFRAGLQEVRCRRELGMTIEQWKWLKLEGNPKFPSYESMVINEIAELRAAASRTAVEIGISGGEAMAIRAKNAMKANSIIGMFLNSLENRVENPETLKKSEEIAFSRAENDTIRTLEKLGDLRSTAEAFQRVYGDSPINKVLYPERDAPKSMEQQGQPLLAIESEGAKRKNFIDPEVMDDVIDELQQMSTEERLRFANGGEEAIT